MYILYLSYSLNFSMRKKYYILFFKLRNMFWCYRYSEYFLWICTEILIVVIGHLSEYFSSLFLESIQIRISVWIIYLLYFYNQALYFEWQNMKNMMIACFEIDLMLQLLARWPKWEVNWLGESLGWCWRKQVLGSHLWTLLPWHQLASLKTHWTAISLCASTFFPMMSQVIRVLIAWLIIPSCIHLPLIDFPLLWKKIFRCNIYVEKLLFIWTLIL